MDIMLVVPLFLVAVSVGVLFYRQTRKAGRELELRRFQNDLAMMARLRQADEALELVPAPIDAGPARHTH